MPKILTLALLFLLAGISDALAQENQEVEVYLITCGPGTETYSIYGHTALRIVIPSRNSDLVYNWGVFDFSTPNFAWKFAKGRLEYMLGVESLNSFLQDYFFEQRWVESQKINLEPDEIEIMFRLIAENLKPENIKYRYDFFYDDCSTRVRDLIEESLGDKLIYPGESKGKIPTFRQKTGEYQKPYPWLNLGINLLMGSPGDRKASFRDRMFLPEELQKVFSDTRIKRGEESISLLEKPVRLLEFDSPSQRRIFIISPVFIFSIILLIVILITGLSRSEKANRITDIVIFSIFSVLALLMIFFNFFTDHQQMKWNLNIIWLNPFIILCLISLIFNLNKLIWFRITFFITALYLVFGPFLPQEFNTSFIPLILILLLRTSVRSAFRWNPYTLPHLTQL